MEVVVYFFSQAFKSSRFRLPWPLGQRKASLTFRLLQCWNTCVMKKGWSSLLFGERKVRGVWEERKHGSGTKAFIIWVIMSDVTAHANSAHPWWCTWLHCACLLGITLTPGHFRAPFHSRRLSFMCTCYFNKYGASKIWLWKLICLLLNHIPFMWDAATHDPLNSPRVPKSYLNSAEHNRVIILEQIQGLQLTNWTWDNNSD